MSTPRPEAANTGVDKVEADKVEAGKDEVAKVELGKVEVAKAEPIKLKADSKHPLLDLLSRYRAIFSAAWAVRDQLAGPKYLADEAAFLPAGLSLQETPMHPAPRRFAYVLMALFALTLLWACFGRIDIVASAAGRIVVSERTKLIQPLEISVVQKILVKDGDRVQVGQVLVELDPTSAKANNQSVSEQLKAAESEVIRSLTLLKALEKTQSSPVISFPKNVPQGWSSNDVGAAEAQLVAEWSNIQAQLGKLNAERSRRQAEIETARAVVGKIEATLPMSRQREEDIKRLTEQGFISGHSGQDRTRERIELERDLVTQRARLLEAQAGLKESENTQAAYLAETRRALYDRQSKADLIRLQATQELVKALQRERLTTLTAPVAGTVQQLAANTVGGVVTEAQILMVIVPDGATMSAEVVLDNRDIGFVYPGQEAEIKLETFNFTRYGTIPALVSFVTQDAVNDEKRGAVFPVTLQLLRNQINVDGKLISLSPGMNVTAEVKTGQRRVIEFLLSPIQKAGSESLRER